MTRFVNRNGHMVSLERAALIDAANGIEADVPTTGPQPPVAEPARILSQSEVALTRAQKAAATRLANKAAKDAALLAAKAAKVEPLRPRNIDPATGEEVVLKEVKDPETGEISQVPVETEGIDESTIADDETLDAAQAEPDDPFDAAVDAAAATAAPADEDEAAALADA